MTQTSKHKLIRSVFDTKTGIVEDQYTGGRVEYSNGLPVENDIGSLLTGLEIDRWKTLPHDEALREALLLFRDSSLEVSERRVRLEVLKFVCELQGILVQSVGTKGQVLAIQINMGTGSSSVSSAPGGV
jgi:hypothetical protein